MNKKDKIILNEIKLSLTKELGKEIHDIILFGSHAYNKENAYSDFDILIILTNNYDSKKKRKINDLCYDISLKYNILIDAKIISLYELNNTIKGIHPLYKDAINKGIHA